MEDLEVDVIHQCERAVRHPHRCEIAELGIRRLMSIPRLPKQQCSDGWQFEVISISNELLDVIHNTVTRQNSLSHHNPTSPQL